MKKTKKKFIFAAITFAIISAFAFTSCEEFLEDEDDDDDDGEYVLKNNDDSNDPNVYEMQAIENIEETE
jgi:hypothetical protein